LHESFGTNWRMLEMQAVIGRIQLRRIKDWSAARARNAQAIWAACAEFAALRVPQVRCASCPGGCEVVGATCEHAHYKCYAYVRPERLAPGWTRDRIIEAINAEDVPCFQGSCSEVYLEKAFDGTGWRPEKRLPVARELGETSIMFLVHPTLMQAEVEKTCEVVRRVMGQANA
jgi:dTDP-4-amino-4,6-dideoxygalactose transaminase